MRTFLSMVAVGIFVTVYSFTASAQTTVRNDGNKLLKHCQGYMKLVDGDAYPADAVFGQGYCLGLVFGVMNTMQVPCPRESGVSGIQAVKVVIKYLEEHPIELGERDTQLVNRSLSDAYPCG